MIEISKKSGWLKSLALGALSLGAGLLAWELAARYGGLPAFILPTPQMVWESFWQAIKDGSLFEHSWATLVEVLAGLAVGIAIAAPLGYLVAKSKRIERLLSPYIIASQAIPVVAIAPLLVIWFKPGLLSKVLISALIVFFPILINTVVGMRSVSEDLYDLMRSLQASRWKIFYKLELPAALPILLGGLRIGATLAVIGAVVGEFTWSDRGLGFLINVGRGHYDTAMVFAAAFTLVIMALALYGLVVFMESKLLSWQERRQS